MKIDYYCFFYFDGETDWHGGNPRYTKEYNSFMRKRGEEDVAHAKKIGKALFFNGHDGNLYFDNECKEAVSDLGGKTVLPRDFSGWRFMVSAIEKFGGVSVIGMEDDAKITRWPDYIQPRFRKIKLTTMGESFKAIKREIKKKDALFIKTVKKDMAGVFENVLRMKDASPQLAKAIDDIVHGKEHYYMLSGEHSLCSLEGKTPIMYTDVIDICKKPLTGRRLEYRGLVVDGVIDDMDLYPSREGERNRVPSDVRDRAYEIMDEVGKTDFPRTYCLDVIRHRHEGKEVLDISEFNNLAYSGREMRNSFFTNEKD